MFMFFFAVNMWGKTHFTVLLVSSAGSSTPPKDGSMLVSEGADLRGPSLPLASSTVKCYQGGAVTGLWPRRLSVRLPSLPPFRVLLMRL